MRTKLFILYSLLALVSAYAQPNVNDDDFELIDSYQVNLNVFLDYQNNREFRTPTKLSIYLVKVSGKSYLLTSLENDNEILHGLMNEQWAVVDSSQGRPGNSSSEVDVTRDIFLSTKKAESGAESIVFSNVWENNMYEGMTVQILDSDTGNIRCGGFKKRRINEKTGYPANELKPVLDIIDKADKLGIIVSRIKR